MKINVEEYYKRYGPMVLRRCRSILKDEDKALDAMQEVFMKVIINRNKLKNQYPSSLLYTIATNICLNIIKSEKKNYSGDNENILLNIADYEETENKIIMQDFIDNLFKHEKTSTREIAYLHYVDKLTLAEVAEHVGLSVSGVRKRLRTFKAKVKYFEGDL
jgi:RNA polymerase sigma-70 factor, ECF subfamily